MSNIGINDKMYVVILFVKLSKGCKRMLKNNIETDVKEKCNEADMTQVEIAEAIGTTKSYVNRVIKKQDGIINKTFIRIMEQLGYDIEITYTKNKAGGKEKWK